MGKVNDTQIFRKKYYPWYYTDNMEINLVPISYYTRLQAELTLKNQFGSQILKSLSIIQGSDAIRQGMVLGKNNFWWYGKRYQVKKYFFPPDLAFNKARRRRYAKFLKNKIKSTSGRSGRKHLLDHFFYKAYGTQFD